MSAAKQDAQLLGERVKQGERLALAQAITLVESDSPEHRDDARTLLEALLPHTGQSIRVGITGSPGVGKSSLIERLGQYLVDRGHRLAVLAVDPTSHVSGGSLLGDKTRMQRLSGLENAFVRPSPSGGVLGGVANKTREAMLLCEAAGFDVVFIETVGVGQSETSVANMVDAVLVLTLTGAGDELQGIKRGLLEVADLAAVTKADGANRAAAERARDELARALALLRGSSAPAVLTCSALEDRGLKELWQTLQSQRQAMQSDGTLTQRRRSQRLCWMWQRVDQDLRQRLRRQPQVQAKLQQLEHAVAGAHIAPDAAAQELIHTFLDSVGVNPGD